MVYIGISRYNVFVAAIRRPHAPIAFLTVSYSKQRLVKASGRLQCLSLDKHAEANGDRNFDRL